MPSNDVSIIILPLEYLNMSKHETVTAFTFAVVMSSDFMIKSLNLIAGLFGGAK